MNKIFYSGLAIILIGVGWWVWSERNERGIVIVPEIQRYESVQYGLSFEYPKNYYLKERVGERPSLALVLVEDTQENRDLLNGVSTEAREGPTSITVEVYENPQQLSAEEWMRELTNWGTGAQEVTPTTIAGTQGLRYRWSGLYEGESTLLTQGAFTYIFSVTWLTPSDAMILDFEELLGSVRFSLPASQ